ncbi:MAG: alpha/beta fold hydrolase [Cyanobium sp.]
MPSDPAAPAPHPDDHPTGSGAPGAAPTGATATHPGGSPSPGEPPPATTPAAGADGQAAEGPDLVAAAAASLLDPLGRQLAAAVQWWALEGLEQHWPVAVLGQGPPLLLLHGFDSSHQEFRRLAPLLAADHRLYIPDLYGFGFCPRPQQGDYSPAGVLRHLEALLQAIAAREGDRPLGLIGASMGGSVAVELARRCPARIARLLLLAPAGLTGRPMPLPPLLDGLGVRFLALPGVRRGLCRSAFADPDRSVGAPELEIASLHLATPGWADSLRRFARSGGFAGCGEPLPSQPLQVLWGENDRILRPPQKRAALALLGSRLQEVPACGHLPHIDQPQLVARVWRQPGTAVQDAGTGTEGA